MEKRAKGLCYRCDEKFAPRHRCKQRELRVLMMLDEEEFEEQSVLEESDAIEVFEGNCLEIQKVKVEANQIKGIELSLNSVVGLASPRTMKLQGKFGSQNVVVLINNEATRNFISSNLVRRLTIQVEETRTYGVLMGTRSVQGTRICKGVLIHLQEMEIVEDYLPFDLTGSNVILGI